MGILARITEIKTKIAEKEAAKKAAEEAKKQDQLKDLQDNFKSLFEEVADLEKEFTDDNFAIDYDSKKSIVTISKDDKKIYAFFVIGKKWKPNRNMRVGRWGFDIFLNQFFVRYQKTNKLKKVKTRYQKTNKLKKVKTRAWKQN